MSRPLIVFTCPSMSSLGELHNALTAALSARLSFEFEFLVSEAFVEYVQTLGFPAHVISKGQAGLDDLARFVEARSPDHLIVADHHLSGLESIGWSVGDVAHFPVSVSTFDSLSLAPHESEMSYALAKLPGAERIHRWLRPSATVEALPDHVGLFRPVPVANGPWETAFSLYPLTPVPASSPTIVRERLGVAPDVRVVVFARSQWARQAYSLLSMLARNKGTGRSPADAMSVWLHHAFKQVGVPVLLIGFGDGKHLPDDPNIEFRDVGLLGMSDFNDLLGVADLYLTDNIVSAAMARAARMGTPCLAMTNVTGAKSTDPFSESWHEGMSRESPGYDFPFLVNPFGWVEELAHLTRDNPYIEALHKAEIFDMDDLVRNIREQLTQPSLAPTRALAGYQNLRPFDEILHALIDVQ